MTTTKTPASAKPAHEHLPIEQIRIDEGANARSQMNGDKLDELTASITASGVLQPVIVHRTMAVDGEQPFALIAGHRRLEASRRAAKATIPALIYDALDAAGQMQIALVENLQREDLSAIDEARGYQQAIEQANLTQQKLAKLTGKSASHISQRLALLKLPAQCQQHIASGQVPLPASKTLAQIASVSASLADACAKLLVDGHVEPHELIEQPHVVLEVLAHDQESDDTPFVHGVDWHGPIRFRGAPTDQQVGTLRQRAQDARMYRFTFTSDDIDAARSYGCLLEFEHQFGTHRFLTDAVWTHDRLCQHLDQREAAATEHASTEPDAPRAASDTAEADDPSSTTTNGANMTQRLELMRREQDERRTQRAAEQQQREAAITANRQLGAALERKLGAKKLDRDTARLLAELILRQNSRMAARGIRYTHPEYHQLQHTRNKNGVTRTRFTVVEPHEAHNKAIEWVLKPSQPEVIIGRLTQLIVAGTFADQNAVAQTHRVTWDRPAHMTQIPELTAKLASKLLPDHFHEAAQRMLPTPPPKPSTPKAKPASAKRTPAKPKRDAKSTPKSAGSKTAAKAKSIRKEAPDAA